LRIVELEVHNGDIIGVGTRCRQIQSPHSERLDLTVR
jgi:hypothetical protein